MASTFSNNLNLELMAKGEQANAWGTITNDNLSAVDAELGLKGTNVQGTGVPQLYVGQKYFHTGENTLYIATSATSTASAGYTRLQAIQGIDTQAASADVVVVTGGDVQAGHVSISGGLNVTGAISAESIALNSATFSAIHVKDTASVSFLKATDANFTSVSAGNLRVSGTASMQSLHVSATACISGPLHLPGS